MHYYLLAYSLRYELCHVPTTLASLFIAVLYRQVPPIDGIEKNDEDSINLLFRFCVNHLNSQIEETKDA